MNDNKEFSVDIPEVNDVNQNNSIEPVVNDNGPVIFDDTIDENNNGIDDIVEDFIDENNNGIDDRVEDIEDETPDENVIVTPDATVEHIDYDGPSNELNYNNSDEDTIDDEFNENAHKSKVLINVDHPEENEVAEENELTPEEKKKLERSNMNIIDIEPENLEINNHSKFKSDYVVVAGLSNDDKKKWRSIYIAITLIGIVILILAFNPVIINKSAEYIELAYHKVFNFINNAKEDTTTRKELNSVTPEYFNNNLESRNDFELKTKLDIPQIDNLVGSYSGGSYNATYYVDKAAKCYFILEAPTNYKSAAGLITGIAEYYTVLKSSIEIESHNSLRWYLLRVGGSASSRKVYAVTEKDKIVYIFSLVADNDYKTFCEDMYNTLMEGIK